MGKISFLSYVHLQCGITEKECIVRNVIQSKMNMIALILDMIRSKRTVWEL